MAGPGNLSKLLSQSQIEGAGVWPGVAQPRAIPRPKEKVSEVPEHGAARGGDSLLHTVPWRVSCKWRVSDPGNVTRCPGLAPTLVSQWAP